MKKSISLLIKGCKKVKRVLDIILSLAGLLLLLPVSIPIMLILKLTGQGEIFYIQQRVGKGAKLFGMIKFSSMVKNSPNIGAGLLTVENDPRIFPFGRFLRKTKVNELPQLINVLKGDMSIVGPRPQVMAHFDFFPEHVKGELIKINPGLTGIGSIVFRDEESILHSNGKSYDEYYKNEIVPYKGELELWYSKNMSLWLDIVLIFLTAWVIFFPHSKLYNKILKGLPKDTVMSTMT
jgi:lipopolysaccharide/colanic/teichoic acid biosynthesis glycosyltransferase